MRKGQTAIEYLMTYGWAILIILVVGGVLYYYGVFSPSKLVGKSKTGFQAGVDLVDWAVDGGNPAVIRVLLTNKAGVDVEIFDATVGTTDAVFAGAPLVNVTISEGSQDTTLRAITATGLNAAVGKAYNTDLTIRYSRSDAPGAELKSSGRISGIAG